MRPRLGAFVVVTVLSGVVALVPLRAEQIHRHQFGGRHTVLVRGDANVRVEVQDHEISTLAFKSQPASEHIKLTAEAASGDSAFIHYHYDTPPAPISELLTATVWVKATRSGIQLRARVVFPNEPDPVNPQTALTTLLVGDTYPAERTRQWWPLKLQDVPDLLAKHLPVLQTRVGRAVNTKEAYIDRLVLNLYAGPGTVDVWVDDLDIGPVKPTPRPGPAAGAPGTAVKNSRMEGRARGRTVEQRGGQLFVDGKPFFFRAIRHTGTPLHVLRQAGFDTLWLPPDASDDLLEDANREGWLIVPTIPLAAAQLDQGIDQDAEAIAPVIRKFSGADLLFWDLGAGRMAEQSRQVERTADLIRRLDPNHPRGADLWDGFQAYSGYLDVIGAHRWPLFTSLSLSKYRDWLAQRKVLTADRATFWTWVQNHLPDWYITEVLGQQPTDPFTDPIGPHPEQVRVLAHIALATGCRGLGFWSDRYLADSHYGRDRLQGMALLNAEIDMLSPVLLAVRERPQWLETNNPNVKAALLRGERDAVLLPIWMGPGMQFVPDQGATPALVIKVPLVHDGADPWRITPAGVECLAHSAKQVVGGTELTITEFDLVCPIVFTSDRPGLVVWWQDYTRKYGRLAARWALDMAAVEYDKVMVVHNKLVAMGVRVEGADLLFKQAERFHQEARKQFASELYDKAYADALRAMRPLRILMRAHWHQATATLSTPTASPYAVSYFSLPRHWQLFAEVQNSRVGVNALPHGDFELADRIPAAGVRVDALPGWTARFGTIDRVNVAAGIIPAPKLAEKPEPRKSPEPPKGLFRPTRPIPTPNEGYTPPTPELGKSLLRLEVRHRGLVDRNGKPVEVSSAPLERTFLAVDSPPVRLPPGTLVRISGWIRVPSEIVGSADGVLFYDDAGGEPLGVRVSHLPHWQQFHLYRRIPPSGQIALTMALTGVGIAYFDDIRIEPLLPNDAKTTADYRGSSGVVPAGGKRR